MAAFTKALGDRLMLLDGNKSKFQIFKFQATIWGLSTL